MSVIPAEAGISENTKNSYTNLTIENTSSLSKISLLRKHRDTLPVLKTKCLTFNPLGPSFPRKRESLSCTTYIQKSIISHILDFTKRSIFPVAIQSIKNIFINNKKEFYMIMQNFSKNSNRKHL